MSTPVRVSAFHSTAIGVSVRIPGYLDRQDNYGDASEIVQDARHPVVAELGQWGLVCMLEYIEAGAYTDTSVFGLFFTPI